MKIRTDYVTNSSSSSFILARKEELSEAQKEAVLGYVARKMLGNAILTPSSSEEEIAKETAYCGGNTVVLLML